MFVNTFDMAVPPASASTPTDVIVVATVTAGRDGTFSVPLPPGDYVSDRLFRDIVHSKYGGDDAQN